MRLFSWVSGVVLMGMMSASAAEAPAGFYRTQFDSGRWYLIDPAGKRFFSAGGTTVEFAQDIKFGTDIKPYGETSQAKYGSVAAWRQAVAVRLMGWNINTLGAWSDDEISKVEVKGRHLAHTSIVSLGSDFVKEQMKGGQAWLQGIFPDVFDPAFAPFCQAEALRRCAPKKDDPNLLGWFTDNELRWQADWRGRDELLVLFLNLPAHTPGRNAAFVLLRQRYTEVAKFNAVWGTSFASWDEAMQAAKFVTPPGATRKEIAAQNAEVVRSAGDEAAVAFLGDCDAFLAVLADRYFQVTRDAIKAADPNRLVIGCRFAYVPAKPIIAAAARYVEVISCNCYGYDPTASLAAYAAFNKPLLIGEFAFRGRDSGLPNTRGAGPLVDTQQERADAFAAYARAALKQPNLVGYQWFEHADEPKEGRFDGENSNYGLVDIQDKPYELLTRKMTEVNGEALQLHEGSGK